MAAEPGQDLPQVEFAWALVFSGPRIFIGVIIEDFNPEDNHDDWLTLKPAYEVTSQLIPTGRHPNGSPIFSKNISAEPILLSFHGSYFSVLATGVTRFKQMHEADRARYKRLVEQAEQMATQARAQEAGLSLPGGSH